MKIRIKGNSLRYRLTRPEVERFIETGFIEDKINFGSGILFYALQKTDEKEISASFLDNRILLFLPQPMIEQWIDDDVVGFEHNMPLPNGGTLFLLIEKDFTCLDKVDEDQSDNYPNPLLKKEYE